MIGAHKKWGAQRPPPLPWPPGYPLRQARKTRMERTFSAGRPGRHPRTLSEPDAKFPPVFGAKSRYGEVRHET